MTTSTDVVNDDVHVLRIMGCDPGGRTGVAVADLWLTHKAMDFGLLRMFEVRLVSMGTFGWEHRGVSLRTTIQGATKDLEKPFIVVTEKYVVTSLTIQSQDTQSIEVNGALESILELLDTPHDYFQVLPSSTKPLFPDAKLRQLGFDLKHTEDHARDALRNICWWAHQFVFNKVQISSKSD